MSQLEKFLEAMKVFVDEIALIKEKLDDVMDAAAAQDKRIEQLEKLMD